MAATRKQQQEERERLEKEYTKRQKLAARKIAPGFLDTDTRILKPQPLYQRDEEDMPSAPRHQQLDYQKFEQGLAPPDPWDQPENDLVALRSILGPSDQGEAYY